MINNAPFDCKPSWHLIVKEIDGSAIVYTNDSKIQNPNPCEKYAKKSLGWTYVDIPEHIQTAMKKIRNKISPEDLGEEGKEEEPHITAKYGLTTSDPEEVRLAVSGNHGGKVKMGKTSIFENDDADVLKIAVSSQALHTLWKALSQLDNEDKHTEYVPHATLAYLKPGSGKKYVGLTDVEDMEFTFDYFTFEDAQDNPTKINLSLKKSAQTAPVILNSKAQDNHGNTFIATLSYKNKTSQDNPSETIEVPYITFSEESGRTSGRWEYRWLDMQSNIGDRLYLDFGQGWILNGLKAIKDEASTVIQAKYTTKIQDKQPLHPDLKLNIPINQPVMDFPDFDDNITFANSKNTIKLAQFDGMDDDWDVDFQWNSKSSNPLGFLNLQELNDNPPENKKLPKDTVRWHYATIPTSNVDLPDLDEYPPNTLVMLAGPSDHGSIVDGYSRSDPEIQAMETKLQEFNIAITPMPMMGVSEYKPYYILTPNNVDRLIGCPQFQWSGKLSRYLRDNLPLHTPLNDVNQTENFELMLKASHGWETYGSFNTKRELLEMITNWIVNGTSFFDLRVNHSVNGPMEIFMLTPYRYLHSRGEQFVFDSYGDAQNALLEINNNPNEYGTNHWYVLGNYSDNPQHQEGRYVVQMLGSNGWRTAMWTMGDNNPSSSNNPYTALSYRQRYINEYHAANENNVRLWDAQTSQPLELYQIQFMDSSGSWNAQNGLGTFATREDAMSTINELMANVENYRVSPLTTHFTRSSNVNPSLYRLKTKLANQIRWSVVKDDTLPECISAMNRLQNHHPGFTLLCTITNSDGEVVLSKTVMNTHDQRESSSMHHITKKSQFDDDFAIDIQEWPLNIDQNRI